MSLGSSIRLSDDGDAESTGRGAEDGSHMLSSGAPELVMPSLAMPDRRPLTERGKKMGRLRVCVAGRKGVGKTSLIRAIVRQCEDIVQVDPLKTTPTYAFSRGNGKMKRKRSDGTSQVTEIMASTKAYPPWWSGSIKESQVMRRRKSGGDGILERNLCFIDTPGFLVGDDDKLTYSNTTQSTQETGYVSVVDYIEEQLWKTETLADISDADRLNIVSGRGTALVDVVLFLFSEGKIYCSNLLTMPLTLHTDKYLQEELNMFLRLSALTNVVPLVGKADLLSSDDLTTFKAKVIQGLNSVTKPVQPFLFGQSTENLLEVLISAEQSDKNTMVDTCEQQDTTLVEPAKTHVLPPFSISSLHGSDALEMDASLLMSSTYSPPLLHSELPALINQLFEPENIPWLRHSAALKFVSWRETKVATMKSSLNNSSLEHTVDALHRQQLHDISAPHALVRRYTEDVRHTMATSLTLMSPAIDTSRLDLLAHMKDSDRALWLLQRVNEEVARGNIGVLAPQTSHAVESQAWTPFASKEQSEDRRRGQQSKRRLDNGEIAAWARRGRGGRTRVVEIDPSDPLGLVKVWEGWGRVVAWSVGGGVVVGAVWVVVVSRGWINGWGAGGRF
jgi:GTPase SAR1 family protein